LIKLHKINSKLNIENKINLEYSDIPFSWEQIRDRKQYILFQDSLIYRDSIIAKQIISKIDSKDFLKNKKHKALIILNYRHGFTNIRLTGNGIKSDNVGRYLKEHFNKKIASVLINTVYNRDDDNFYTLQNGKWDAAFELSVKYNVGFDLANSPFVQDSFDLYPIKNDLLYKDVFQGFIYTSPVDSFIFEKGVENFITNDFKDEFRRRALLQGFEYRDSMINDYNLRMQWRMSEKQWCPNYDGLKDQIEKKNTCRNTVSFANPFPCR
jgi:hypothetical protein